MKWNTICALEDIIPGTGICALINQEHVAVFRPGKDEQLFALSNIDPFAGSSVMSRGLIGETGGEFYVASPLLKQRFSLKSGRCFENDDVQIKTFEVRADKGKVQIKG